MEIYFRRLESVDINVLAILCGAVVPQTIGGFIPGIYISLIKVYNKQVYQLLSIYNYILYIMRILSKLVNT